MTGLATLLVAVGLSYAGTWLLLRLRLRAEFIDVPNERSSHETPKPRFGGIAMAGAFFVVFGALLVVRADVRPFLPLLLGGTIVFAVGVIDDWRSLPVSVRFIMQALAALIVVAGGGVLREITLPMMEPIDLGVAGPPLTVLFILTCINFYNFIDGIDGLAAGSAAIASGFLAAIALMLGHSGLALICLALAGASAGFLQFNFPPSKLFMGDGGSTFLGFFFACVAVSGSTLDPPLPVFVPILMLSALFVDAGFTLVKRLIKGEQIFQAHRTHYFQRLVSLGFNHKQVTVLEYALTIMLGLSALVYFKAGGLFPVVVSLLWVGVFTALMLKIRGLERGDRMFWERRTALVIGGDIVLIALAYFGAYFLRTGFRFTDPEGMATLKAFPIVVVVRSACFYYYGLYRGMWKYTSTPDVLRIIKAVTAGTAIIVVLFVLAYRFTAIPRSLIVIEYFLLILALTGARFANRLFHELGREALDGSVRRVAIIGAGDYGERLGREIRNTEGPNTAVVCYIDDAKDKSGLILQGVPILGPISDLPQICASYDVDALLIGIRSLPDEKVRAILRLAREADVPLERGDAGRAQEVLSHDVVFDRLSRDLSRNLPMEPVAAVEAFFRNKPVLITNAGAGIGESLVAELSAMGARVAIQIDSPHEAERFDLYAGDVSVIMGSIDREADAGRVLSAVEPRVVIHVVALECPAALNRDEFLWRRVARSARSLQQVLPGYPVECVLACELWGGVAAGDYGAILAAAAETALLNSADLSPCAPRIVRLPRILTRRDVDRVAAANGSFSTGPSRYAMHELEAATLLLNAAARGRARSILAPRDEGDFGDREVGRAVAHRRGVRERAGTTQPRARGGEARPVFPTETTKPSMVPAAKEIISPLHPASDVLVGYVSQCLQAFADGPDGRFGQPMKLLRSTLLERAQHVSVDESTG